MKTTETHWSCDICGKDKITVAGGFYVPRGHAIYGESVGVSIKCAPIGQYREHLCQQCAEQAIVDLAKTLSA